MNHEDILKITAETDIPSKCHYLTYYQETCGVIFLKPWKVDVSVVKQIKMKYLSMSSWKINSPAELVHFLHCSCLFIKFIYCVPDIGYACLIIYVESIFNNSADTVSLLVLSV